MVAIDVQPAADGSPVHLHGAAVVFRSRSARAASTRTRSPPWPLAATATRPATRKASPPNIVCSRTVGLSASIFRTRAANRAS